MIEKIVHGDRVPFSDLNRPLDNVPTDGSNNPVKSDGIYDSEKDIYAVMGEMGAKNLIPFDMVKAASTVGKWSGNTYTNNGITWEYNPTDGTVTAVSGTATAQSTIYYTIRNATYGINLKAGTYTLSGCPDGGTDNTYKLYINSRRQADNVNGSGLSNYGGEKSITYSNDMWIGCYAIIASGYEITTPLVFKPMLRLASDTDDTYQRYAKTNKQLTDEIANKVDKVEGKGLSTNDYDDTEKGKVADNTAAIGAIENVTGAKNVLKYPYTDSTNTQGGLTFTDNGDGTVTVSGSETTGANVYFALENNISVTLGTKVSDIFPTAGKYTISCKNADGTNIYMSVYIADVGSFDHISEDGTDVEITNAMMSKTLRIHLEVKHDYVLSSAVTLKPMIRPAGTDATYVPYSMTNKQLTDKVEELTEKTTKHSVTIEPISPNDLQGSTLSVVNGVLVGSVCFFRTDSTDYLLRQWVTVAHTSLRLSQPIQTSLYSEVEGLSGGLMNIGTNGDIMVFQNYYDPTGTATKRGASGMFSTPI